MVVLKKGIESWLLPLAKLESIPPPPEHCIRRETQTLEKNQVASDEGQMGEKQSTPRNSGQRQILRTLVQEDVLGGGRMLLEAQICLGTLFSHLLTLGLYF